MTEISDEMEETYAGASSRETHKDRVFECLRFKTTVGARGVGLSDPPGRVGGHVGFPSSHLVDPSRHELTQPHKGPKV